VGRGGPRHLRSLAPRRGHQEAALDAHDADGVEEVVGAVSGVTRVTGREDGKLEFETLPGADPRPEVARALVQAGYDLLEMRAIGVSLEDIFLQLTRDEPAPLEPAGDALLGNEPLDSELPE